MNQYIRTLDDGDAIARAIDASEIDTSTSEGFAAGLDLLNLRPSRASVILGTSESTIKNYCKKYPPNPAAAKMVEWMLAGYRPHNWHVSGNGLRRRRERLELTQDELAIILDTETETVAKYESDSRGPPLCVAMAVEWMLRGFRPPEWPTDDEAA